MKLSNTSIWMTPKSFVEKFWDNPKLLRATIRVEYRSGDENTREIALKVMYLQPLTLATLQSVKVRFAVRAVKGIAFLSDYVAAMRNPTSESDFEYVRYPIVDKKHGLIFNLDSSHEATAGFMFAAYEGFHAAPLAEHGAQYVLRGHGYYRSSVGRGYFYVGKILFDKEALDENDAAVLEGSIKIVEVVADIKEDNVR